VVAAIDLSRKTVMQIRYNYAWAMGRGLNSSTFQLNVSAFCGQHTSTFPLDVITLFGHVGRSSAKASQVELRSGRLLWLQ